MMHSVMMTSDPPLLYLEPDSLEIMKQVTTWRDSGLKVCYTVDAGPNIHCICVADDSNEVERRLRSIGEVLEILRCTPGDGVNLATNM